MRLIDGSGGDILRFAHNALERGHGCALVTLVEIIGGASRALGAHMAIADNGSYCGYVSGGCVEGIVAREALMALAEGRDRELRLGRGRPISMSRYPVVAALSCRSISFAKSNQ
ncbi:XdhC family protein [Ochrobactrum oryzae]|nr:XdhC family protein [Brucella oryzae]